MTPIKLILFTGCLCLLEGIDAMPQAFYYINDLYPQRPLFAVSPSKRMAERLLEESGSNTNRKRMSERYYKEELDMEKLIDRALNPHSPSERSSLGKRSFEHERSPQQQSRRPPPGRRFYYRRGFTSKRGEYHFGGGAKFGTLDIYEEVPSRTKVTAYHE